MFISSEASVLGMTRSPTNSLWFQHFMQGCHRRMVSRSSLNNARRIGHSGGLRKGLGAFLPQSRWAPQTALAGVMITAGLGGGMHGEELNRVDIGIIQ